MLPTKTTFEIAELPFADIFFYPTPYLLEGLPVIQDAIIVLIRENFGEECFPNAVIDLEIIWR